jgi:LysR family transcriptional regulator, nitrogen assimilation regulatory protein
MDLRQLEYFVRVAELGSFTRAAHALKIAQPALSRQVRLLEVELRQNLLVRNGRGALPTEAGQLLLEHGRGILHQVARAQEEIGRVRGKLAGRVAIGMPTSVAKLMAVPLVHAFRERLPDARLAISEGLSIGMQEALQAGRLDIALLYNPQPSPTLELTPLIEEPLMLVQRAPASAKKAPASALPLKDLAAIELVIPTRPNAIRNLVEAELSALGKRPKIALEIDGVAAILDLVADGAGAAVLPVNAIKTAVHPELYHARPIAGLKSRLALATSSERPATLTQRAVHEIVTELTLQLFKF